MNGDHTPPLCSNEHAQFTRLTWSETIERPEEIYFLESEVAPEVERLVKHKAALLQLAREGLQIQSAASLVMWQKRLEFCIANEPTPPQPASNDLSYIQEVQHHCDRIIWRGRYYHLENMRPADEIESLRAMIRVKDKDYQALRAAHDSLSFETNDSVVYAPCEKHTGMTFRAVVLAGPLFRKVCPACLPSHPLNLGDSVRTGQEGQS